MIITSKLKLCLLLATALFALMIMWSTHAYAATITSNGTGGGTWATGLTWVGGVAPVSTDNAVIAGGDTVTLGADAQIVDLTILGTLDASTYTLTVTGDWDSSAGLFTEVISTVVLGTNGVTKTLTTANNEDFRNITIIAGATVNAASNMQYRGTLTVNGTLSINTGITVSDNWNAGWVINTGGTLTGAGTYREYQNTTTANTFDGTISVATYWYSSRGSETVRRAFTTGVYGDGVTATNVLISGYHDQYHDYCELSGTNSTFEVKGNLTIVGNQNTIQNILDNETYDKTIIVRGNLVIGHPSNTQIGGAFIAGTGTSVTIGGDVVLYAGSINLGGDGVWTNELDAGSSTINVGGNWVNNDTFTAGTSTVDFNGTVAQGITSGGNSLYNLTISNTSDIVSLSDDLSLLAGGTLTINAGATLDLNGNNLTVPTTFNNNGTLQLEGGETVPVPVNGTGSLVKYDGTAGPYTLKNWTYDSLQLSSPSATTYNMPGPLTLNGSLTIDVNNTLDTNNNNLNVVNY